MRKALGRGLEALFPDTTGRAADHPMLVGVDEITPNPVQPRRYFNPEALTALSESIRRHGLLQPLVVRPAERGYELIAGERRLRAATLAGLAEVPVVIREAAREERLELALIENLQREDLSALEEAEAYRHLIDEYGLTQDEIARRVGKSRPTITNALRLLSLPEVVKAQLESGELSAGHARAVLAAGEPAAQVAFAREITTLKLPKSAAERLVSARRPSGRNRAITTGDVHLRAVAEELTRGLGTRVRITRRGRGGAIEIEFYSDAELERLVGRLRAPGSTRFEPSRTETPGADLL